MNNKGQSLILFVLILPIIVLVFAFIFNTGLQYSNKIKVTGTIENNLKVILEKKIMDINKINLVIKENIDSENEIKIIDNKIYIKVKVNEKSAFSHLLPIDDIKEYNYCGDYETYEIYENEECL